MNSREIAQAEHAKRKAKPVMRSLPAAGACPYIGDKVDKSCGSLLYRCTLHGTTTTQYTKCDTAARHCPTCTAKGENGPAVGVPAVPLTFPARLLIESKRTEFVHYSTAAGDGVVYIGGGKYWPMIVAGIHMLRASGCALPVEVWYRGGEEPVYADDVEGLNVRLLDSNAVADALGIPRVLAGHDGGWSNKLFALYHTEFSRVLFLDADAYCIRNPAELFCVLDAVPFAYWRDLPSQNNAVKWRNVYPEGERANIPPVQGGQLLIDRTRAARLIHTAKFMCDNAGYFFKQMYGDQDTWRVALSLGCSEYRIIEQAHWVHGIAFYCGLDRDNPVIVHRCQGKLYAPQDIPAGKTKYTNPCYAIPREAELFGHFAEVVNKRPLPDTDIFNVIYARQLWGAGSGSGSTLKEARPFLDFLNPLIQSKGYTKLVDAGCGDGVLANLYQVREYVGYDASTDIIAQVRKKFPSKSFVPLDILKGFDKMDSGDVLVCKDVLHHQPNGWVRAFLAALIESKRYKCVVFVYDTRGAILGADCHTGGYRALSADLPPLNLTMWDVRRQYQHKEISVKFL